MELQTKTESYLKSASHFTFIVIILIRNLHKTEMVSNIKSQILHICILIISIMMIRIFFW